MNSITDHIISTAAASASTIIIIALYCAGRALAALLGIDVAVPPFVNHGAIVTMVGCVCAAICTGDITPRSRNVVVVCAALWSYYVAASHPHHA